MAKWKLPDEYLGIVFCVFRHFRCMESESLFSKSATKKEHAEFQQQSNKCVFQKEWRKLPLQNHKYSMSLNMIEGSLNRNFRQYGQLKSRVE